ncbi:unnamed protein product [Allacma fusca]|uniref:Uncharacterized protein n=1 Tax=Allacma fusca TaxID=39272 RepID=A0A8J2PCV5_9HEXA|nr:unnamed protein product [Allacma fusca]
MPTTSYICFHSSKCQVVFEAGKKIKKIVFPIKGICITDLNHSTKHEIVFLENSNESEDAPVFKSTLKPPTGGGRKISTISIISLQSEKEVKYIPEIEFESEKRSDIVQENVLKTKKFFQLYKLRTYLSFLENLFPKMDQVKEKIEEFCDESESSEVQSDEFFNFTSEVDDEIEGMIEDFREFADVKSKLVSHLSSLTTELNSIEILMKNAFSTQLYDKEYLQIENHIRKLYIPGTVTDPPNFDKAMDFILESPIMTGSIRFKSMALEAFVQTMENTGSLFKFNSEIIRLAAQVKEFEATIENSELRKLFSDAVQTVIWEEYVTITMTDASKGQLHGYLQASDQIQGYVRLIESDEGDANLWNFIPIPETKGHYFYVKNKKYDTLLGLKRDGPEYRQIHHRPLQSGYFNQHWHILVDYHNQLVLKNRAHFDLVLTSNAASNVFPSAFTQHQLQCWKLG